MQWPFLVFQPEDVREWVDATLADLERSEGWGLEQFRSTATFHIRFLERVRSRHPQINPYYYDLPQSMVRAAFPEMPIPKGPPGPYLVEEPPFITIAPWLPATAEQLCATP